MNTIAYRPAEAAKAVGMSRSKFYQLLKSGEIRGFHLGTCHLIPEAELRAWVERRTAAGGEGRGDA